MATVTWNDQQGSRDRWSWAILVQNKTVIPFKGASLKGVVRVDGEEYKKSGKWSSSTYRLSLAEGVRFVSGLAGWETGTLMEGVAKALETAPIDSWDQMAEALGADVPSLMAWVRDASPKSARLMDARTEEI